MSGHEPYYESYTRPRLLPAGSSSQRRVVLKDPCATSLLSASVSSSSSVSCTTQLRYSIPANATLPTSTTTELWSVSRVGPYVPVLLPPLPAPQPKHNDTSTCSSRYCRWTCAGAGTNVPDCCNSNACEGQTAQTCKSLACRNPAAHRQSVNSAC